MSPYRDAPPKNDRRAVHAIEALEEAEIHDDIAAACLAMIRNGLDEQTAIGMAIRELIRSRAHLRSELTRMLENHAVPMTFIVEKKP
jgi:hypothetical protein